MHTAHSEDRASIGSATERRRTSDEEVKKSRRNGKRLLVPVCRCGPHESLISWYQGPGNKLTGTAELRIPYLFAFMGRMAAGDPALRRSFCRHPTRADRDIRNTTTLTRSRQPLSDRPYRRKLYQWTRVLRVLVLLTHRSPIFVVRNHDVSKPLRWKASAGRLL